MLIATPNAEKLSTSTRFGRTKRRALPTTSAGAIIAGVSAGELARVTPLLLASGAPVRDVCRVYKRLRVNTIEATILVSGQYGRTPRVFYQFGSSALRLARSTFA